MIVGDQHPRLHLRRRLGTGWACIVLVLLGLVMTLPAAADPLVLDGPADAETVGRHFEYTTDPDWQLTVDDFVAGTAPALQPLPGPVPDFGYTPALNWLRLDLVNATADIASWRFFVQANFTQRIAVYRLDAAGHVDTLLDETTHTPFSARPVDYPQLVAPFQLAPGEAATLIVAYYSQGSSRISMSIETPDSFAALARINDSKNYAFYGMMLVLIGLATVALIALRQSVFAAYAAYITSLLLYIAHADGVAFQFLWPGLPEFNSMASMVAGTAVMVSGSLFSMSILQTRRYHPRMHRLLLGLVTVLLLLDIVLWTTDPQLLKRIFVVMIFLSALMWLTAGIVAARHRFREVRFFIFAWSASLIPATLFTARFALGLETTLITPYDTVRLALVLDALLMGLAVFDRYNQLRQAALADTLAHAQRNLALGERLAVLEGRYAQATALAAQREAGVKDTVHDLRQPMHALRLSLRQMVGAGPGNGTDIRQVESALAYMESLVAERLGQEPTPVAGEAAVPSAPPGGLDPPPTATDPGLHEVMRGVADMFAPEAAARGLDLRLVLAAGDAPVAAYPLMRLLANLVSNAIKYTPQGRVLITLRRQGSGHRIEVHDTGPGLRGADFEAALQRSHRLDRDRDLAPGTGLGLSVVRQIAAEQGWRLTSDPRRRTGATLRLDLPGAQTSLHPAAEPAPASIAG